MVRQMDDGQGTPLLDGADFTGRLDVIERRLTQRARDPLPTGMTEPDPTTPDERWEAAQVWAHMAEFIGYWHEQFDSVIAKYAGEPVPFGRTKRDEARIAAIEVGRHAPVDELVGAVRESLTAFRRRMAGYTAPEWNAVGRHETLGSMDLEAMVERFIVSHLEEHLDQLDGLVGSSSAT